MEKETIEKETFTDENGILKCQVVYTTNLCILNEVIIKGNLQIIVMAIIRNLEDDDETTLLIEIYNKNVPDDIIENNYICFSCEYNDLESYSMDGHLQKEITATLALSDKYRL